MAAADVPTPKELLTSVVDRHSSISDMGAKKEHFKVKDSNYVPDDVKQQLKSSFTDKLNRLDKFVNEADSSLSDSSNFQSLERRKKQIEVGLKTKQIMIKSRSVGDSGIAPEDRLYLSVQTSIVSDPQSIITQKAQDDRSNSNPAIGDTPKGLKANGAKLYIYVSKTNTIAEVLSQVEKRFPTQVLGSNDLKHFATKNGDNEWATSIQQKHQMVLVVCTSDSPSWTDWNRNQVASKILADFEDIFIFYWPLEEVLANQSKLSTIEGKLKKHEDQSTKQIVPKVPEKNQLLKGDRKWYKKTVSSIPVLVEIVGVHFDDYPNIYYTIKAIDEDEVSFKEKQTDENRLYDIDDTKVGVVSPLSVKGE